MMGFAAIIDILLIIMVPTIILVVSFVVPFVNKSKDAKRNKEVNDFVKSQLQNVKFKISKQFRLIDMSTVNGVNSNGDYQMIYVDAEDKKVALIDYSSGKLVVVDFNEIIGCEVYENNAVDSTSWGWNSGNVDVQEKCFEIKLKIKINNLDRPQVDYTLVSEKYGLKKTGDEYKEIMSKAQGVKAFFDVLKTDNVSKRKKFIYCRFCGQKNNEESLKCVSCGGGLK